MGNVSHFQNMQDVSWFNIPRLVKFLRSHILKKGSMIMKNVILENGREIFWSC